MKNKIKPVFIISLPRSGSTLLQKILMSHSKISSSPECWFMLPFVYANKSSGSISCFSNITSSSAFNDIINILPNKDLEYYSYLNNFAVSIYNGLSKPNDKYFIDKTPRYYLILPELIKIFPEAKFIFLFRNPASVFASLITTYGNNRFKLLQSRVNFEGVMKGPKLLADGYTMIQDKSISIQYEEFVKSPEKHLHILLDFLGLEYEETILEIFHLQNLKGKKGSFYDPNTDIYKEKIVNTTHEKWKSVFSTGYRKNILKEYIQKMDENTISVLGYNKNELINEINSLRTHTRINFVKDFIDYNRAKLMNKSARSSFD